MTRISKKLEKIKKEYIRGHLLIALKNSKVKEVKDFYNIESQKANYKIQQIIDCNEKLKREKKNSNT